MLPFREFREQMMMKDQTARVFTKTEENRGSERERKLERRGSNLNVLI